MQRAPSLPSKQKRPHQLSTVSFERALCEPPSRVSNAKFHRACSAERRSADSHDLTSG